MDHKRNNNTNPHPHQNITSGNDSSVSSAIPSIIDINRNHDNDKLPAISSIWDCDKVNKDTSANKWKCGWCHSTFKPINSTKAVAHVTKSSGFHVRRCIKRIPKPYSDRYQILMSRGKDKKQARKRSAEEI